MTERKRAHCPSGHLIPHRCENGKFCKKAECGEALPGAAVVTETAKSNVLDLDALKATDPKETDRLARLSQVGLKRTLKGEEAVKWAQEKVVELLPEAVANVAYNLRYGSDKQRDEATDRILRANGMDKKDAGSTGQHGLVILNLGPQSDASSLPWLQRMKPTPQQVAKAVDVQPEDEE